MLGFFIILLCGNIFLGACYLLARVVSTYRQKDVQKHIPLISLRGFRHIYIPKIIHWIIY